MHKAKERGYISKTACASLYCPTAQAMIDAAAKRAETAEQLERVNTNILKSDALCDATGQYWCQGCRGRYEIMQYGDAHGYPDMRFPPFAVAHDRQVWQLLCAFGRPECIAAWRMALGLDEDEITQEDDNHVKPYSD